MNNRIMNLVLTGLVALLLLASVPMAFAAPPLQDATATAAPGGVSTVEPSPMVVTDTTTTAPGAVATTEATVEASPAVTSTVEAGAADAGAATSTPAGAAAPGALPATGGTVSSGATLMIVLMSLSVVLLGSGMMAYWLSTRRQGK